MDLNEVFIEGRIVENAVLHKDEADYRNSRATFVLACNEDKRVEGKWEKHAQFVEVVLVAGYAEKMARVLIKSERVVVLGKIRSTTTGKRLIIEALKVRVYTGFREKPDPED